MIIQTIDGEEYTYPDDFSRPRVVYGLIVTYEAAEAILSHSEGKFQNRQIRQERVNEYSNDMRKRLWEHDGQTIIFRQGDGALIDGYTRLWAVYTGNTWFVTDARFGSPEEAVKTIDTGRQRTLANALHMSGEDTSTVLSQAIRWSMRYECDAIEERQKINITHQSAMSYLATHRSLRDSVKAIAPISRKRIASPGVLAATHYWISKDGEPEQVEEFFRKLGEGVDLKRNDPIYVVRERLITADPRDKEVNSQKFTWILVAWDKWSKGESMTRLKTPDAPPRVGR